MRYVLFTILAIVVLFFSCHKSKTYLIEDEEILRATTFKEGSYFIYKDSVSGREDSLWVSYYSNQLGAVRIEDQNGDKREINAYRLMGDSGQVAFLNGSPNPYINGEYFVNGNFYNMMVGLFIQKPFKLGEISSNPIHNTVSLNFLNSITVLNNIYSNVYVNKTTFVGCKGCTDTTIVTTYYSADNGMVKYVSEGVENFTLHLVRSNIIR